MPKELTRDEQRAKDRQDELDRQEKVRKAVAKNEEEALAEARARLKGEQNITVVEGKP